MNKEEIIYKNDLYSQIAETPYLHNKGMDLQEINNNLPEDYTIIEETLPKENEPKDSLMLYSPDKHEIVFVIKGTTITDYKEVREDFEIFRDFVKESQVFKSRSHDIRHGTLVQTAKEYNKKRGDFSSMYDINNFQLEIIRLHDKLTNFISKYDLDKLKLIDRPSIKIVSHSLGSAKGLGVQEALRTIDYPDFESEDQIDIYFKPYKIPNLFDVEHIAFAPMPYPANPDDNSFYFLNAVNVNNHKGDIYNHDPMRLLVYSTDNDYVVQDNRFLTIKNLLSKNQVKSIKGKGNVNYKYVVVDQKEITGHALSNFLPIKKKKEYYLPFSKKILQDKDFVHLFNKNTQDSIIVLKPPPQRPPIELQDNIFEIFGASKQLPKEQYFLPIEKRKRRLNKSKSILTTSTQRQTQTQRPFESDTAIDIIRINDTINDYSLKKYCKKYPNDYKCRHYQLGLEIQ